MRNWYESKLRHCADRVCANDDLEEWSDDVSLEEIVCDRGGRRRFHGMETASRFPIGS